MLRPPRRWMCCGCCTTRCSTLLPSGLTTRRVTGSSSARGTAPAPITRCSRPKASCRLPTFGGFDSPLGYHPDRNLVPGAEVSSGSLGHGLPLAVGAALGLRAQGIGARVVVLVGDAELDEGSNAEATEFAAAAGLSALTVVAVDNFSATWPWRGGLETRFEVAGWRAVRVDGRDHASLAGALARRTESDAPNLVVVEVEAAS